MNYSCLSHTACRSGMQQRPFFFPHWWWEELTVASTEGLPGLGSTAVATGETGWLDGCCMSWRADMELLGELTGRHNTCCERWHAIWLTDRRGLDKLAGWVWHYLRGISVHLCGRLAIHPDTWSFCPVQWRRQEGLRQRILLELNLSGEKWGCHT